MKKGSCLIVGGGPGLGLALAKKFGTEGFDIGVITKRPPVLEAMEDALKPLGIRFTPLVGDLADFAALAKAIDEFVEKRGVPSVLIYNAAGYGDGNALAQNPEGLMHDLRVSVGAFVVAYQKLFEAMSLAGGASWSPAGALPTSRLSTTCRWVLARRQLTTWSTASPPR